MKRNRRSLRLSAFARAVVPAGVGAVLLAILAQGCGSRGPLFDDLDATTTVVVAPKDDAAAQSGPPDAPVEAAAAMKPDAGSGPLQCGLCVATTCGQGITSCVGSASCRGALTCIVQQCFLGGSLGGLGGFGRPDGGGGGGGGARDAGVRDAAAGDGGRDGGGSDGGLVDAGTGGHAPGSGGLNLQCILGCATSAGGTSGSDLIQIFTCLTGDCGGACGSLLGGLGGGIPGLGGGAGGGGNLPAPGLSSEPTEAEREALHEAFSAWPELVSR